MSVDFLYEMEISKVREEKKLIEEVSKIFQESDENARLAYVGIENGQCYICGKHYHYNVMIYDKKADSYIGVCPKCCLRCGIAFEKEKEWKRCKKKWRK